MFVQYNIINFKLEHPRMNLIGTVFCHFLTLQFEIRLSVKIDETPTKCKVISRKHVLVVNVSSKTNNYFNYDHLLHLLRYSKLLTMSLSKPLTTNGNKVRTEVNGGISHSLSSNPVQSAFCCIKIST